VQRYGRTGRRTWSNYYNDSKMHLIQEPWNGKKKKEKTTGRAKRPKGKKKPSYPRAGEGKKKKRPPPLHCQQQGPKTSIIPSASDPQHLFTYPYNVPEHSKSIPWTFVAKGDLWAPKTGQRTYSSTPHHSMHHGYPINDSIFVMTA
jgi:hypothetical protein